MTLPKTWALCRFEDLIDPAPGAMVDGPFGSALKSSDYTADGCRVIRLSNIGPARFSDADRAFIDLGRFASLQRHEARAGDILTAALGDPLGRSCIVPDDLGPAIVKADCFRSRLHARVNAELIMFWLNSPALARYFDERGKGVGRVRITLAVLRKAPLPLPPEADQSLLVERIRTVASRADTAKTEADQALAAAQALKISGLRAGVMGKMTEGWRHTTPDAETADALLERVAPPAQPSGGRRASDTLMAGAAAIAVNDPGTSLPKGWRWTPLLRLARQETGHTPSRRRPEYWNGDVPWLGISDARKHHGQMIGATAQHISRAGLEASSARLLPAQTVCMSRTASVGYVTILGCPMATSQDFVTWTCTEALLPEYLMYALMAESKGIRRFGRGSTHTTIYFPELRAFHIALPPVEEQQVIASRIKRLLHRADVLAAEAVRARTIAENLVRRTISQAMTGTVVFGGAKGTTAQQLLSAIANERAILAQSQRRSSPLRATKTAPPLLPTSPETAMDAAQLTSMIQESGGAMRADQLWIRSGLPIDIFYRLLRAEIEAGRISEAEDKETLLAN